jgi:hypothetical protein
VTAVTRDEWLASTDPRPMLRSLRARPPGRKLRLFMVACCRRVWRSFEGDEEDHGRQEAVEVAERYANGLASDDDLETALADLTDGAPHRRADCCSNASCVAFEAEDDPAEWAVIAAEEASFRAVGEDYGNRDPLERAELAAQTALLRCIVPGPERAASSSAAPWRTVEVASLAEAAYEERELPSGELRTDRLAVLSDALEEAGCTDADLLSHLRSAGPHVRGCWALDRVLGKE